MSDDHIVDAELEAGVTIDADQGDDGEASVGVPNREYVEVAGQEVIESEGGEKIIVVKESDS